MQVSRRLSDARTQEQELDRSAEQARTRRRTGPQGSRFQPAFAPAPVPMRPGSSPDPAVETLEELADLGAFVILAPTPQSGLSPAISFSVLKGVA
jgi:hypothetical protein